MIQLKDHWATSAQTTGPWQHVAAEQGRHDRSLARRLGTNGNDDGQVHRRSSYGCKDISQLIQCRDEGVHGGVRLKQLKLGGAGRDTDGVTLPKRDKREIQTRLNHSGAAGTSLPAVSCNLRRGAVWVRPTPSVRTRCVLPALHLCMLWECWNLSSLFMSARRGQNTLTVRHGDQTSRIQDGKFGSAAKCLPTHGHHGTAKQPR